MFPPQTICNTVIIWGSVDWQQLQDIMIHLAPLLLPAIFC